MCLCVHVNSAANQTSHHWIQKYTTLLRVAVKSVTFPTKYNMLQGDPLHSPPVALKYRGCIQKNILSKMGAHNDFYKILRCVMLIL